MKCLKVQVVLIIALLFLGCSSGVERPEQTFAHFGTTVGRFEPRSVTKYETITLFFGASMLDNENRTPDSRQIRMKLAENFQSFSSAIGAKNFGLWVGTLSKRDAYFDINQGKAYADFYGQNYNSGPFVVFTRSEDFIAKRPQALVLRFQGIGGDRIIYVLNELETKIRTGNQGNPSFELWTQYLLTLKDEYLDRNVDWMKEVVLEWVKS
jgi:hypothetical protein